MAVTSKDVADRLGISQPTVSRILSGDKQYKVSPATRKLIFSTAEEMGYRANALARSLRNKRTDVIGLYTQPHVLDTRQEFFAYLYGGLQRGCETHHVDVLVHKTFEGRRPEDVFGEMVDGRTDGAIVYTSANDSLVTRLQTATLPIIAVADPLPGIPSVGCEDVLGMTEMMEYLWSRGHRRFAFLAPKHQSNAVIRRHETFSNYLEMKGLDPEDRIVKHVASGEAEQAVDTLVGLLKRPSAVCCWNDRTAYDVLRHCLVRSLRVPEDLAVAGFDGFVGSKLPLLDLVTVRVPWYEMAQTAVAVLIDKIAGRPIPMETLLPVEFLPGNTV